MARLLAGVDAWAVAMWVEGALREDLRLKLESTPEEAEEAGAILEEGREVVAAAEVPIILPLLHLW